MANATRRLAPRLGIARQRKLDAAVHCRSWLAIALAQARCKSLFSRWAAATPSAWRREQRPRPRRGKVGGRARRRALCARCSRLVSQVSLRVSRHARTHEHLLHHTAWTAIGMLASCARRPQEGSGAHIQWISLSVQVVYSWICWWCKPWCNGSRRFAACVDRERSPDRPLITRVQHTL